MRRKWKNTIIGRCVLLDLLSRWLSVLACGRDRKERFVHVRCSAASEAHFQQKLICLSRASRPMADGLFHGAAPAQAAHILIEITRFS